MTSLYIWSAYNLRWDASGPAGSAPKRRERAPRPARSARTACSPTSPSQLNERSAGADAAARAAARPALPPRTWRGEAEGRPRPRIPTAGPGRGRDRRRSRRTGPLPEGRRQMTGTARGTALAVSRRSLRAAGSRVARASTSLVPALCGRWAPVGGISGSAWLARTRSPPDAARQGVYLRAWRRQGHRPFPGPVRASHSRRREAAAQRRRRRTILVAEKYALAPGAARCHSESPVFAGRARLKAGGLSPTARCDTLRVATRA